MTVHVAERRLAIKARPVLPAFDARTAKRVLFISYAFPPVGGAGVQRTTKFVKYLPRHGWQTSVLTVSNPSVPAFDYSLQEDIPPETIVRRAWTWEPSYGIKSVVGANAAWTVSDLAFKSLVCSLFGRLGRILLQPDPQMLWLPAAVREGKRLLSELPHHAIIVSGPPFSSFLVGAALSRFCGLPLVLDYRDEWGLSSAYTENKRPNRVSRFLQSRMENHAARSARILLATTRSSKEALEMVRRDARSSADVHWIYNGFDPDDFPARSPFAICRDRQYRLAYVGTLWELTGVRPLVDAVCRLAERQPALLERLELVFVGRRLPLQQSALAELANLPCRITEHPYLDHDRATEMIRSADGVCALLSDLPGAERVVPAKIFEYMAAQRRILGIAPRGEMWDLLKAYPLASCRIPSDIDGIAQWLATELQSCRTGNASDDEIPCDVGRFSRDSQAGELAALLNSIVQTKA